MKTRIINTAVAAIVLPLGVFAAASTPPTSLIDLTTNGSRPSGSVVSSSDYSSTYKADHYNGTKAFDGTSSDETSRWLPQVADNMWVVYTFDVPTVVDSIRILLPDPKYSTASSTASRAPKAWKFQGSNDKSTWADLDSQTDETSWSVGEKRFYKLQSPDTGLPNTKAYKYYKFNCTANNGATDCMQIQEMEFYCVGTGDSTWTGSGETSLVNDDGNWGGASMPGSECKAHIDNTGDTPATIPGGLTVYKFLRVGAGSGNSAKVVQETGTVCVQGDSNVGYDSGSYGEYKMSGGTHATTTSVFIGYGDGSQGLSQGLFEMTGGTLFTTNMLSIGRFGQGTFSASGDGTVVTAANVRVGFTYNKDKNKGYGTFIVTNGAEVATTKIYAGAGTSHVDRAKVVFDGAVLTATAASAEFLKDLLDVTLGAGGLTINTEGKAVTITNCKFFAEPGAKITVTGGGTVTFANCTVAFTEKPGRSFAFAETDGVFSGMPEFSNIGGSNVVMSGDNKKISIVRHGLMIIFQ